MHKPHSGFNPADKLVIIIFSQKRNNVRRVYTVTITSNIGNRGFKFASRKKATPIAAITSGMKAITNMEFRAPTTTGRDLTPAAVSPRISETSPRKSVTMANNPKKIAEK